MLALLTLTQTGGTSYSYGDDEAPAVSTAAGCGGSCPDEWISDGTCDAKCNIEECHWDGADCFHDASECWHEPDGSDYRGKVSKTKYGRPCQVWSEQIPWRHTKTTVNYPTSGLGGHNYCRNPDGESGPWCYTLDYPDTRWELCDVGERSARPCLAGGPEVEAEREVAIAIDRPVTDSLAERELRYYGVTIPPELSGFKVELAPLSGDQDLYLSFVRRPAARTAGEQIRAESASHLPRVGAGQALPLACLGHVGRGERRRQGVHTPPL